MKSITRSLAPLDRLLALFLQYGTWSACAFIGVGVMLEAIANAGVVAEGTDAYGDKALTAGVALFIVLPLLRVALMLVVFVRQRNYRYVAIAATVLVIVATGCVLGVRLAPAGG
jgi:Protein of unknown function (DUF1634)